MTNLRVELKGSRERALWLEKAAKAALLFHSNPPWGREHQQYWEELTGVPVEATTKQLCMFIRLCLREAGVELPELTGGGNVDA